jgi:TatA/E family protein of Tat protein translocase
MFGAVGIPELIMIFIVVLFLFGPDKLPDFAKTFGKTLKEFRKTVNEAKSAIEEEIGKIDITQDVKNELNAIDLNIKDDLKEVEVDIQKIAKMEIEDGRQTEQEPK